MDMQSKQVPWQGRGLEHSVPVKRAMAETMGDKPGGASMQTGTGVPVWAAGLECAGSC